MDFDKIEKMNVDEILKELKGDFAKSEEKTEEKSEERNENPLESPPAKSSEGAEEKAFDTSRLAEVFGKNAVGTAENSVSGTTYSEPEIAQKPFAFDISDEPYHEEQSEKPVKKKGKFLPVFLAFVITLAVAVLVTVTAAFLDIGGIAMGDRYVEVNIPHGAHAQQIAEELHEAGAIRFPFLFRLYTRLWDADVGFQQGEYLVNQANSYQEILGILQGERQSGAEVAVTIPEGFNMNQIADLMEENEIATRDEFLYVMENGSFDHPFVAQIPAGEVYFRLEGYLYPDTYRFYKDTDGTQGIERAEMAINRMLDRMAQVLTEEFEAQAREMGFTVHEIMTMASILEMEASGNDEDMRKIAQVFYNRLNWTHEPPMLRSCPTRDYPDPRFNTYEIEGLPPGPMNSPGSLSINAAINPDTSVSAYFFVSDSDGNNHFMNTYQEHLQMIAYLRRAGRWLGD